MFFTWINPFKRSPRAGDGKDLPMSSIIESPGTAVPGNVSSSIAAPLPSAASTAPPSPDVSQQIADLTAAVNRLVQAQPIRIPVSGPPPLDIGGDIPGGRSLTPTVDYAKLSPLQQITLGLRDAKPVGPGKPGVVRTGGGVQREGDGADDRGPSGAD